MVGTPLLGNPGSVTGYRSNLDKILRFSDLVTFADGRVRLVERFARHYPSRCFVWLGYHAVGRRVFGHQIWTKVGDIHRNYSTYIAHSLEPIGGRSQRLFADSLPDIERSVWGKFSFQFSFNFFRVAE